MGTHVKIDLYLNSTHILEIADNLFNEDRYLWEVWQGSNYSLANYSLYQIRIEDCASPEFFDFSSNFTIENEKYLEIISPEGNTSYESGDIMDITWRTDTPTEYMSIDLMKDNISILQISPSTDNTRSFEWIIPSYLKTGADYYLRINATDNSAHDYSETFTIIGNPTIPVYLIPLLLTGIFLIALCLFILNYKKVLNRK